MHSVYTVHTIYSQYIHSVYTVIKYIQNMYTICTLYTRPLSVQALREDLRTKRGDEEEKEVGGGVVRGISYTRAWGGRQSIIFSSFW